MNRLQQQQKKQKQKSNNLFCSLNICGRPSKSSSYEVDTAPFLPPLAQFATGLCPK